MEPIPETAEVLRRLGAPGTDASGRLVVLGDRVRAIVPDCVGLSWAVLEDGLVFTLVASDAEIAVLDAMQYLASGPCLEAVRDGGRVVETTQTDLFDEAAWRLVAASAAAHGVESTLTLPLCEGGDVTGSVNIYAASPHAFRGRHEQLAQSLDAWAPGAVSNADLSFRTRRAAQAAPQRLDDLDLIHVATGILAVRLGLDVDEARGRLRQSAERAGLSEAQVAGAIIDDLEEPDD